MQSMRQAAAGMMRAVRVSQFGGPEVLKVQDNVPVPEPAENQVLIKVGAAGINPVETYIRTGTHNVKPDLPYTPGSDVAGIVQKAGAQVKLFKPGDRVFTTGTVSGAYAEFAVAEEGSTYPLTDRYSFAEGASLGIPIFTAYRALHLKTQVKPGEVVLIHGASGAVGLLSCQLAKSLGAVVIGTAGTEDGLALVKQNGADFAFNHREENYEKNIMDVTKGVGVHVVVEMLANVNLERDLQMVRQNGRIIVIGSRGKIEITPRLAMVKESSITGLLLPTASPEEWVQMREGVGRYLDQGVVKPVIAAEYSLDRAPQAHHDVIHNSGSKGKLIFKL